MHIDYHVDDIQLDHEDITKDNLKNGGSLYFFLSLLCVDCFV